MHIELVDALRCPFPHEDTWLVASVTRFDGRDIVEGSLGCPSCRRQFAVRDGEVDFSAGTTARAGASPPAALWAAPAHGAAGEGDVGAASPADEAVLRARALLSLGEPGGIVLLGGDRACYAESLEREVQVMTLMLNAPAAVRRPGCHPSALRAIDGVPVASGALRGVWLDRTTATPAILAGAARALRRGGRLVAPADAPLPAGVRALARDAAEWVAEGDGGVSAPVPLRRR